MAKKFENISASEDVTEPEDEAVEETSDAPSGVPPAKTATRAGSAPGGGGRRPKKVTQEAGLFTRISQFLRDTRAEMRRVSWPTLVMVRNTTLITLVAVVFFAVYLFAVDRIWTFLIDNLRTALGG
ncbi:MAG: preprotein translocase subunit SecE [Pyrinomonadaceae bacterium]